MELLNQITVNAHSSVRVADRGRVAYVDPFALKDAPRDADLIFLTHAHFDHYSPEDVAKVVKPETIFVLPASIRAEAAPSTEGHPVVAVEPGQRYEAGGLAFETVAAYNPGKPFHPRQNRWVGYVLDLAQSRVYIAGDTDATPEAAAVRCDVALLPIGGKYTMDPAEAADLANRLRPQAVLPIHYGSVTGSPGDFAHFAPLVDPAIQVVRVI